MAASVPVVAGRTVVGGGGGGMEFAEPAPPVMAVGILALNTEGRNVVGGKTVIGVLAVAVGVSVSFLGAAPA